MAEIRPCCRGDNLRLKSKWLNRLSCILALLPYWGPISLQYYRNMGSFLPPGLLSGWDLPLSPPGTQISSMVKPSEVIPSLKILLAVEDFGSPAAFVTHTTQWSSKPGCCREATWLLAPSLSFCRTLDKSFNFSVCFTSGQRMSSLVIHFSLYIIYIEP